MVRAASRSASAPSVCPRMCRALPRRYRALALPGSIWSACRGLGLQDKSVPEPNKLLPVSPHTSLEQL